MTSSSIELEQIARSQTRQQVLLIVVCILLIASTIATWKSVSAMREANQIQRQLLAERAEAPARSPQKRQASTRPASKASADSRRTRSARAEAGSGRQATLDGTVPADPAATHALVARSGRQ
jgi:hypothetical protein